MITLREYIAANEMRPIHPGEILREELDVIGLSANAFAHKLCVPINRITEILNAKRNLTADTAIRLAQFFGNSPRILAKFTGRL